ncbi:MAG: spore coat protein CotH [Myxococcota bacterium]|jgi:spore coat protein CotH
MWSLLALACIPTTFDVPGSGKDTDPGDSVEDTTPATNDSGIESIVGDGTDTDTDTDLTSEDLFDESTIPKLYLEMSSDSIAALIDEPYEYVQATFSWRDVSYGPIGVRTKGENSWRPFDEKTSLKLDFNRYEGGPDRFLELKGLTLNAMNEDYSMMHERVGYHLYRAAGVPAARAHHAQVYLNGELYGLFVMLDTVDDVFLERWFDDATGSMFEQHDGDFTDAYVQDNTYFQLEEGKDDRTALQAVADALESSGPDAIAAAGEHLSWEAFHRYWAAGSVVMNFDAYPFRFAGDDCHVYFDPTSERLIYIPHGVDESFYYNNNFETAAAGHLAARCREVSSCRDDWARIVYDVLDVADKIDLHGYAEDVRDQIEQAVRDDPERNYSLDYVEYYQQDMINKILNRRTDVTNFIGARPE